MVAEIECRFILQRRWEGIEVAKKKDASSTAGRPCRSRWYAGCVTRVRASAEMRG